MKVNKSYFLSFLLLFALSVCAYAQSVRYVAYFPVPYLTHQKIEANTAYFAGKDGAKVEVEGMFQGANLVTAKDLEVTGTSSTSAVIQGVNVGGSVSDTTGDFVVDKQNGTLSFTNVPKTTTQSILNGEPVTIITNSVNELKADNNLKVKAVKWRSVDQNNNAVVNNAFVKGSQSSSSTSVLTGFPSDTKKLCWMPLRLKGSYEYQYYLVAVTDCCPEDKAANGGSCPS